MTEEQEMTRLARQQHGVVAVWQTPAHRHLRARLVASGRWRPVTPEVLAAAGAPPTARQSAMAAVLDAGRGSVASHATAAALWQLPGFGFGSLEVMREGRRTSRQPPIARLHRPVLLLPHHVTAVEGIPVTSLARTVFDLAAVRVPAGRLARVVDTVGSRSPGALSSLHAMLPELAERGRPGIRVMRAILADAPAGSRRPTGLERRFETILRHAGAPPLERQVDVGGHEWLGRVDYFDPAVRLVVEVDSMVHHTSPMDRALDEARDASMLDAGVRMVLRIPEEHIWYEPWKVPVAVQSARQQLGASAAA